MEREGPQSQYGFLSLPAEVREHVYSYLVPTECTYSIEFLRRAAEGEGFARHDGNAQDENDEEGGSDEDEDECVSGGSSGPGIPVTGYDCQSVRLLDLEEDDDKPVLRFRATNLMCTNPRIRDECTWILYHNQPLHSPMRFK